MKSPSGQTKKTASLSARSARGVNVKRFSSFTECFGGGLLLQNRNFTQNLGRGFER